MGNAINIPKITLHWVKEVALVRIKRERKLNGEKAMVGRESSSEI